MYPLLLVSNMFILGLTCLVMFLVLFFIIAASWLVVWLMKKRQRKNGQVWSHSAQMLGLQLDSPSKQNLSDFDKIRDKFGANVKPENGLTTQTMSGQFGGRDVKVWIRQYRYKSNYTDAQTRQYYTCCRAEYKKKEGLQFSVRRRDLKRSVVSEIVGKQTFTLNYKPFDNVYIISGSNPQLIYSLLTKQTDNKQSIAEYLIYFANSDWKISLNEGEAYAEVKGMVLEAGRISEGLQIVTEIAKFMERI